MTAEAIAARSPYPGHHSNGRVFNVQDSAPGHGMRAPARHWIPTRLLVAVLVAAAVTLVAGTVQAEQPVVVEEYVVEAGDTLWAIAARVTPHDEDVRETLSIVRDVNRIQGSTIHPGQVLLLPTG